MTNFKHSHFKIWTENSREIFWKTKSISCVTSKSRLEFNLIKRKHQQQHSPSPQPCLMITRRRNGSTWLLVLFSAIFRLHQLHCNSRAWLTRCSSKLPSCTCCFPEKPFVSGELDFWRDAKSETLVGKHRHVPLQVLNPCWVLVIDAPSDRYHHCLDQKYFIVGNERFVCMAVSPFCFIRVHEVTEINLPSYTTTNSCLLFQQRRVDLWVPIGQMERGKWGQRIGIVGWLEGWPVGSPLGIFNLIIEGAIEQLNKSEKQRTGMLWMHKNQNHLSSFQEE